MILFIEAGTGREGGGENGTKLGWRNPGALKVVRGANGGKLGEEAESFEGYEGGNGEKLSDGGKEAGMLGPLSFEALHSAPGTPHR